MAGYLAAVRTVAVDFRSASVLHFQTLQCWTQWRGRHFRPTVLERRNEIFKQVEECRQAGVETPFSPSKLLAVWRIRALKGRPYWEKDIIKKLHLEERDRTIAIVKNTPSQNKMLMKVKHLVRIKPIMVPDKFLKEGDYSGTYLKHTGELVVSPKLKVDPQQLEAGPREYLRLDPETLENELRKEWEK